MSLNNALAGYQIVGKINEATDLVVTMDGINTLSVILECIGGAFANEVYSIHVSNNGERTGLKYLIYCLAMMLPQQTHFPIIVR